jgi:hypothetical protein
VSLSNEDGEERAVSDSEVSTGGGGKAKKAGGCPLGLAEFLREERRARDMNGLVWVTVARSFQQSGLQRVQSGGDYSELQ